MKPYKFTLLLGAGFTKNFGGPLGHEMWSLIFNQPEIQKNRKLKEKMLSDFNYENLYLTIIQEKNGVTNEEALAFQSAVHKAYSHLDSICHNLPPSSAFWGRCCNSFLDLFKPREEGVNGFVFTLNQDLFFERNYYYSNIIMPGIMRNAPQFATQFNDAYSYPINEDGDYYELPSKEDLAESPLDAELGQFNYIKLHGSYNFRKHNGWNERQMVIGGSKKEAISKEPLLNEYFKVFEKAIASSQTKLLVLGYGFRDQHINRILNDASHDDRVKIYVMDPCGPDELRSRMCSQCGTAIWENLSGYFPYALNGLFDSNGVELPGWKDLLVNYFEIL